MIFLVSDFKNSPDGNISGWHVYDKDKCFFYLDKESVIKAHGNREILFCCIEENKTYRGKFIAYITLA